METHIDRKFVHAAMFATLCVVVLAARAAESGSLAFAVGRGSVEIPGTVVFGRLFLWLLDRVALFTYNLLRPETPKNRFQRNVWQTLSLSLLVGFPVVALLARRVE